MNPFFLQLIFLFITVQNTLLASGMKMEIKVVSRGGECEVTIINKSAAPYELDTWKGLPRGMVVEVWKDEIGGRLEHATLREVRDVFLIFPTVLIDVNASKTFVFKFDELAPRAATASDKALVKDILKNGITFGCDVRIILQDVKDEVASDLHHVDGVGQTPKR